MAGEHTLTLTMEGLEELIGSLNDLASKYPDKAGELLQKNARKLRKNVIENVKDLTESDGESKYSLSKAKSYAISPIQGFGADQFVEISAKAPHFHLVEHGHDLVSHSGEKIGFVQGKHMMNNAVKKANEDMPDTVEDMVTKLLKEEGLL